MNISNLPDEILVLVFSYFSQRDLIENIVKVCKRWERLGTDKSLWKSVFCFGNAESSLTSSLVDKRFYSTSYVSVNELLWLAQNGIKIANLELEHCTNKNVKSIFKCCIQYRMQLTEITVFTETEIHIEDVICLATSPAGLTVKEITVFSEEADRAGALSFSHFPNLQRFECYSMLHTEFRRLILTHFSTLRSIYLMNVDLPNEDLKTILNNLKVLNQIHFSECRVEKDLAFEAFQGNEKLEDVQIGGTTTIGDDAVMGDYETPIDYTPIVSLPNLKRLNLDFSAAKYLPPRQFEYASKSITYLEHVDIMDDHDEYSTDEMLAVVGRRLTDLRTLKLGAHRVTDKGLNHFLTEANKLEELTIQNSDHRYLQGTPDEKFSKIFGDEWVNVIGTHPCLKKLDVAWCYHLKEENIEKLKVATKSAKINFIFTDKYRRTS